MKYSIVYPYYKRPQVLNQSLTALCTYYANRHDVEVIFVLDLKNTSVERDTFFAQLEPFWDKIKIVVLNNDIFSYNSCRAYNIAIEKAQGEYIILSNPECIHKTNIIAGMDEEFAKNSDAYIVCACESISQDGTVEMWYQHSQHNNRLLHFCTAISKKNYLAIGGFSEDYIYGIAFEDDEFRNRVIKARYPIICRDDLLVSHLSHSRDYNVLPELSEKNRRVYKSNWEGK